MAEKGFGVKEINLIGASGTPTIESPNNLNLNAVNVAISTNVSIGGTLTVSGNVSVGGTLTYEDVTNIDSVGIITARNAIDCNGDIDVDGHTNLDNVSVAGVTTISNDLYIKSSLPKIYLTDTNHDSDWYISNSDGTIIFYDQTTTNTRFEINPGGSRPFIRTPFNTDSIFRGETTLGGHAASPSHSLTVGGNSIFSGISTFQDIDVDGHTNLDNVSIAGVATVTGSNINIEGGSASLSQLKINSTGRFRGVQLDENGTRKAHFQHDATDNKTVVGTAEGTLQFNSGDTPRVVLNSSGHWVPYADSTYDLGITGTRWRNVYADTLYGDGSNLTNLPADTPTNSDIQVAYTVTANGSSAYRFAGNGVVSTADDPDLYLIRGQKYRFINNSGGSHPFQIREASGGSAYSSGVTNNGAASGNIDFQVPYSAPSRLYYQCTAHGGMVGNLYIRGAGGQNDNVGVTTFSGAVNVTAAITADDFRTDSSSSTLYLTSANDWRFRTTGGSEKLRINSSGKVIIGNNGTTFGNAAVQAFIQHGNTAGESGFSSVDTTSVAAGVGGEIAFHGKYNTGAQDYAYLGHIRGIKENATAGNTACALTFHTRPNATAPQERLRITSAGAVVTGGTTAQASDAVTLMPDGEVTAAGFYFSNNIGSPMNSDGIRRHTTGTICIDTGSQERVRIDSSGNVGIGEDSPAGKLHISSGTSGDCVLIIEADTDNNNEDDNPRIEFRQDGGLPISAIGHGLLSGDQNGLVFANSVTGGYMAFATGDGANDHTQATERARITAGGYSKHSNDGTYDGYSNALDAHEFRQSANKPTLWCSNSNSSHTWDIIRAESARTGSSSYQFIVCTSGNLTDDEFRVRGDGQVYADGSFNPNGADYAEYFEWTDGNSSNEDRRGMTVVLDGNKIKVATSSDSTDNIIGVVSGNASVIADSSWNKWSGKYQKDDYGAYLKDENGERKLNPSFDDTKTYISREDRQEWDAIGMVGKLRIRKGQKTGTRWIKMRDVSDSVEEWLVR